MSALGLPAKVDMQATQAETPMVSFLADLPDSFNSTEEEEKVNWLIPAEELTNQSLDYNGKMVKFVVPLDSSN